MASGAMGADAGPETSVLEYWRRAQKLYKRIQRDVNGLKRVAPADIPDAKWQSLESTQADLRLACVTILFADHAYGVKNKVDQTLWNSHTQVNSAYRDANRRFPPELRVQKRNLETRYTEWISLSQLFYKGYIQRLSEKFDLEVLHRLASAVHVPRGPGEGCVRQISDSLKAVIIQSVQELLTYLGDLSRYRYQIRPNPRDTQSAVTYYSLAHDMQPDNGFPLHQIGFAYLESDKHLEVVYYFYLALARAKPHVHASLNLEAKLKTVKDATSFSSGAAAPHLILGGRTAQLHAKYMANEPFATREELEKTILLRLEQQLQAPDPENVALKIALVNMGSYYHSQKFEEPRPYASAFSLAFNVRYLGVICRALSAHIEEAQGLMPGESTGQDQIVAPGVETAVLVLRLYCCWLSSHPKDLGQAPVEVQHLIQDMWKAFAKVAGAVVDYFKGYVVILSRRSRLPLPPTAPYLLKEDEEAVGYLALGSPSSEIYRRMFHKEDSVRKPNLREFDGQVLTPFGELVCRVGDIMASIQHFAIDAAFPVTSGTDTNGNFYMEYGYGYNNAVTEPQRPRVSQQQVTGSSPNGAMKETPEAANIHQRPTQDGTDAAAGVATEMPSTDAEQQAYNMRQIEELVQDASIQDPSHAADGQHNVEAKSHCDPLPWPSYTPAVPRSPEWRRLTAEDFEKSLNRILGRSDMNPPPSSPPRISSGGSPKSPPSVLPSNPPKNPPRNPPRSRRAPEGQAGEVDQRDRMQRLLRGGPLAPKSQSNAAQNADQVSARRQDTKAAQAGPAGPAGQSSNSHTTQRTLYRPGQSLRTLPGVTSHANQGNAGSRPQSGYGPQSGRGGRGRGHNRQASQGQQGQTAAPQGPQLYRPGHHQRNSRDNTAGRGGRGGAGAGTSAGANKTEPEAAPQRSKPWR